MSTATSPALTWTATAEVAPRAGNAMLGSAAGAYVAVVGVGCSEQEFRVGVERAMGALDFELIVLEDVRQLRSSADIAGIDDVLRDRVSMLHEGNPVECGSFHAFS
jgi:hypothetical protein